MPQISDSYWTALILGGDFFTGAVLAAALTKLVLPFDDSAQEVSSNTLRAEDPRLRCILITFQPGDVDDGVNFPSRPVQVFNRAD